MKIPIVVFMSEIKVNITLKNIKFSVSFMLLFTIIMSTLTSESYLFPSHFASISSCSACLVGIIWSKYTVLYLENEPKYHFNN